MLKLLNKKINKQAGRKLKKPKAQLEGVSISKLQELIWNKQGRKFPSYFDKYLFSPNLMSIYKILVHEPVFWSDGVMYKLDPVEKLHEVFASDYRHIYQYEASTDFFMAVGEYNVLAKRPIDVSIKDCRKILAGNTVLMRRDTRYDGDTGDNSVVDIQILSGGLFQDVVSEEYRNFKMDISDFFAYVRPYLKLIDGDGMEER